VAGSHRQHALYIWDKATGSLVKMLTGQKGETLLDIAVSTVSQFLCLHVDQKERMMVVCGWLLFL
jgi:hypothetical protein